MMRVGTLPKLFSFKSRLIYFDVADKDQGVNVHIAQKSFGCDDARFWLEEPGTCRLAHNNGGIPQSELEEIKLFVTLNYNLICERWKEEVGNLKFHSDIA